MGKVKLVIDDRLIEASEEQSVLEAANGISYSFSIRPTSFPDDFLLFLQ